VVEPQEKLSESRWMADRVWRQNWMGLGFT
jgi:hypothetical protein